MLLQNRKDNIHARIKPIKGDALSGGVLPIKTEPSSVKKSPLKKLFVQYSVLHAERYIARFDKYRLPHLKKDSHSHQMALQSALVLIVILLQVANDAKELCLKHVRSATFDKNKVPISYVLPFTMTVKPQSSLP